MSRSYKRVPVAKGCPAYGTSKAAKRMANRRVRQYKDDVPSGNGYKRIYPSWLIFDGKSRCVAGMLATTGWIADWIERRIEAEREAQWGLVAAGHSARRIRSSPEDWDIRRGELKRYLWARWYRHK